MPSRAERFSKPTSLEQRLERLDYLHSEFERHRQAAVQAVEDYETAYRELLATLECERAEVEARAANLEKIEALLPPIGGQDEKAFVVHGTVTGRITSDKPNFSEVENRGEPKLSLADRGEKTLPERSPPLQDDLPF
jgi:hypothetical protein